MCKYTVNCYCINHFECVYFMELIVGFHINFLFANEFITLSWLLNGYFTKAWPT